MAEPARVSVAVEVRYAETDAMGIVHHANYPIWFELARTRLCQETGQHYADIERSGYRLTVTRVSVRYLRPAHYGQCVHVESWIDRLASRGVRFGYRVTHDDVVLATGATEHIWIDREGRPCRIPEALRPGFSRLARAER